MQFESPHHDPKHDDRSDDHLDDPALPRSGIRPGTTFVLLLIAVAAFAGYRLFLARPAVAPKVDNTPQVVREGARIRIPDGSPMRGKLTIEPVTQQEIERTRVLPAAVEPDPARLAKVMTPLSGRVTELNVQLGQRVDAGQGLLVVDSSDLGTAYSDYDKAKVLLDLARKTRDRLRDLAKIGGAALKNQQQGETDNVTPQAGRQRAGARPTATR